MKAWMSCHQLFHVYVAVVVTLEFLVILLKG